MSSKIKYSYLKISKENNKIIVISTQIKVQNMSKTTYKIAKYFKIKLQNMLKIAFKIVKLSKIKVQNMFKIAFRIVKFSKI